MGKIMILSTSDEEEKIFNQIQKYLHKTGNFCTIELDEEMLLCFPGLEINLYDRKVRTEKGIVLLTDLEFRLLLILARNPGRIFTYKQIYEAVWEVEYAHEKGNIMSHIRHIRKKLEVDGKPCGYIENIRGVGYRFKKQ